ncbi:MAG: DUF3387 domain-containing protein, partial [bacterium]|nr:DUF3387 domain-containing protein [bacterium]
LELFEALAQEIPGRADAAREAGLSETGLAVYGLLTSHVEDDVVAEPQALYDGIDGPRKALAENIVEAVAEEIRIVDWVHKEDVQREMRRRIKRHLTAGHYHAEEGDRIALGILELIKAREGR